VIRAALDTSVVVSAVISPSGPNAQVFDLIIAEKIMPCVSNVILEEYRTVFTYNHLRRLDQARIESRTK
jgi:putative PIN family toxin of toxin-antitoxin system